MQRCDVLLISPPSRFDNHYRPPLGLMYVAGYYRSKGLNVRISDFPFDRTIRNKKFFEDKNDLVQKSRFKILREVANLSPKLIGIGCYSTELDEVKSLVQEIRKHTNTPIVIGGVHPTLKPHDFDGISNYVVQGRLDNGLPCYDLVNMDYYSQANPYAIRGVFLRCAYVLGSFGCPSQCTFCVSKKLMQFYKKLELKDPHTLYNEIVMLRDRYAIDGFYLIDDLYTIDKKKVLEFCSLIKKERLLWGCSSKVSYINEELIKAMSKTGCIQIDFGVERGRDVDLQEVKKGITIKQIKETFRLCRKHRVRTFGNFIVGLPGEKDEHRRAIQSLLDEIKPTVVSINPFTAYEGTEIHDRALKEEITETLLAWVKYNNRKYNSVWRNLSFHLSWRYLTTIAHSKRKSDYWRRIWLLLLELINQKLA